MQMVFDRMKTEFFVLKSNLKHNKNYKCYNFCACDTESIKIFIFVHEQNMYA